ncbi:hypothetical protein PFISCL1PPCAC_20224, partial [Pristionchus fissidentatus]
KVSQKDLMRLSSKVNEIPRPERAQPGYCKRRSLQLSYRTFSMVARSVMCGEIPPCMHMIFSATRAHTGIQLNTFTKLPYLDTSVDVISEEEIRLVHGIAASREHNAKFAELTMKITHDV